jgi:hypothetical protein
LYIECSARQKKNQPIAICYGLGVKRSEKVEGGRATHAFGNSILPSPAATSKFCKIEVSTANVKLCTSFEPMQVRFPMRNKIQKPCVKIRGFI